jgi:non-specific serine/threonine protein kinase
VPEFLTIAASPAGALRAEPGEEPDGLSAGSRRRAAEAFARGHAHGLLYLGAAEPATPLAPALRWARDLGRAFVTRLCGTPDVEVLGARAEVAPAEAELDALAAAVPPFAGAEYVDRARLGAWWDELRAALAAELAAELDGATLADWLRARSGVWNLVGRVTLHLAENKGDEACPFAFLATYATRVGSGAKVQHRPLAQAVREGQAARDKGQLLSLLVPVQRAAERSVLVADLLASGDLFEPLAWTPAEARRFLEEIPALEAAGVIVRVPNWWRARRPPRPEVTVAVGGKAPGQGVLGADALLDFKVNVTIDGEPLTPRELAALLAAPDGLAFVRGRWVELDREKLNAVLEHWKKVERDAAAEGLSFLEGMRLLAGTPPADAPALPDDAAGWSRVVAGDWLARTLAGMRAPDAAAADPGPALRGALRPYQRAGLGWLRLATTLRLGVCLADDMGLGKTVQVIALLLLRKREQQAPSLLVIPASLVANWQAELERFAPSLRFAVVHPSAGPPPAAAPRDVDLVITTYGQLSRVDWLREAEFDLCVLDEAQAIKNAATRQTRAAKAVRARARVALTGTPVENRLGDLWSLFDFLQPGLLGTASEFGKLVKKLAARAEEPYAPLRRLVQPYILRRMKTDRAVAPDLPAKTEVKAYCALSRAQAALYQRAVDDLAAELAGVDGMKRRGVVLATLMRLKQICNHPSQWLGDARWDEPASGKFQRLRELAEPVAARQEKALIFTQFREICEPLAAFLADAFGRPGLVLHGSTSVKERGALVKRFQEDDAVPFFVLSVKAGGTGLNLTAASHVIHFDRWWNPAVENQATDRAFRIGQTKNVLVHKLVCRGTVEERIDAMIEAKKGLAEKLVDGGGAETLLTELQDDELLALVSLDIKRAAEEA